ncbi:transposase [Streptomyces sp. IB201691-2A2]|uniref:IS110 family transposase n=1 Tax=Streptomyces sp. IB201691-2A2 TaxID=2561920 RepID=UPI00117C825B|nr:hypothetical protein E4K73_50635 [Streptomyces sp. IB201691-2A2]
MRPKAARVVVSDPHKTRAIAEARVKTDKVGARILAQLPAADFLPPVWLPDERASRRRRLVGRRTHVVRQLARIKNQVHSMLSTVPCSTSRGRWSHPPGGTPHNRPPRVCAPSLCAGPARRRSRL